jgi:hypothetical protein
VRRPPPPPAHALPSHSAPRSDSRRESRRSRLSPWRDTWCATSSVPQGCALRSAGESAPPHPHPIEWDTMGRMSHRVRSCRERAPASLRDGNTRGFAPSRHDTGSKGSGVRSRHPHAAGGVSPAMARRTPMCPNRRDSNFLPRGGLRHPCRVARRAVRACCRRGRHREHPAACDDTSEPAAGR